MRKTKLFVGLLAVAGALATGGKASADLITNGNFESGNTGFTSGYTADSTSGAGINAGANGGAAYYGIVTDSQFWHASFTDFKDHTSGSGNMMIVNGDIAANTTVWQESGIAVTPGATYELSFWATSAYPVSPASLHITGSAGALNDTFTLSSSAGTWQHYTKTFVANTSSMTLGMVDTNIDASGNDFALDDFSLTQTASAVPLPASAWSGGVLIGGMALKKLFRRQKQA